MSKIKMNMSEVKNVKLCRSEVPYGIKMMMLEKYEIKDENRWFSTKNNKGMFKIPLIVKFLYYDEKKRLYYFIREEGTYTTSDFDTAKKYVDWLVIYEEGFLHNKKGKCDFKWVDHNIRVHDLKKPCLLYEVYPVLSTDYTYHSYKKDEKMKTYEKMV